MPEYTKMVLASYITCPSCHAINMPGHAKMPSSSADPVLPSGNNYAYIHTADNEENALVKELKKAPPDKENHEETDTCKWPVLSSCQIHTLAFARREIQGLTCFTNNSQLMRTAARLYFLLSSRKRPDSSPIRSKLSPRYRRSSIFLVMTFVTSLSSSFSRSRFCDARLS